MLNIELRKHILHKTQNTTEIAEASVCVLSEVTEYVKHLAASC